MMMKNLVAVVFLSLLTACGFEPLYVQKKSGGFWGGEYDQSISSEMEKVKIEATGERFGQLIRNDLLDLMTPLGVPHKPKYRLLVEPQKEVVYDQALRNDITATRKKVIYTVSYVLKNAEYKTLITGNSVAYTGYDILRDPYSTTFAQKKVEKNAAKIIANDISLRLGAYFHSIQTNRGNPDEY